MANIQFILDGSIVSPPQNWKSLAFELNFDRDERQLDSGALVWLGAQAKKINDYVALGNNGGVGIFEGMSLRVEVCETNEILFNGYLDLVDADTLFECDRVVTQIKEAGEIDWLNDIADSFSFAFLYANGNIQYSDFKDIPYVVSSIPDYTQLLPLSISLYTIAVEIFKTFKEIGITISDAIGGITGIAGAIVYIGALLIYIGLLIAAVIALIKNFIQELIQPDKFKKGMLIRTHFEAAADYLGLAFSSSIFELGGKYADMHIIPKKTVIKNLRVEDERVRSLSPLSYGHYDGTFKDFIIDMEDMFNAKVVVKRGFLIFEREDFFNDQSAFIIPQIEIEGVGTNMSELNTNFYLSYQVDQQEQNTLDFYTGTSVQVTHVPAVINSEKARLLKGLNQKRIPFARCVRKTSFTRVEKTLQVAVDNVGLLYLSMGVMFGLLGWILSAVLAAVATPSFNISYRIGWLLLSNDFTGVPKVGLFDAQGKLTSTSEGTTSANTLMNDFHRTLFPIDAVNNDHNQYERFENRRVKMCCADFKKVKNNNVIKDSDGNLGKLESLKWNPFNEESVISYRIKKKITSNFVEKIVIDGQQ